MSTKKFTNINRQKGVSLIITFFIMMIVLSVVLSISTLLYVQIKAIRNMGNSVISYYAAESGIEKVLYYDIKLAHDEDTGHACPQCDTEDTMYNCPQCDTDYVCKHINPNNPNATPHCVNPGVIRGLCWMILSENNPNYCAPYGGQLNTNQGIYCNATPPKTNPPVINPPGCNPDVCNGCEVDFTTTFDNESYSVKASHNNAITSISSTGSYGNVSREINISVPDNP